MAWTRMRVDELANAWVGDRNTPFQLGMLGVFEPGPWRRPDGTLDRTSLVRELALRAGRVPELRRRVLWTRLGEGRPLWVEDPTFQPAGHVGSTTLAADEDLCTWAANRCADAVDLDLPPWRAEVVDGLSDGRFAVLVVVHHVLADGLAGVRLVGSLLDPAPDTVRSGAPRSTPSAAPSHRELVRDRWGSVRASTRAWAGDLAAAAATRAHYGPSVAGRPPREPERRPLAGVRDAMEGFRVPLPTTSLPATVGPGRRMVVSSSGLAQVRLTCHVLGVTVNDLVLAVVTMGLHDLLAGRGECSDGVFLRTTVPVATGTAGQVMGMIVVDLPVAETDPLRRLALITEATTLRKARLRATGGDVSGILRMPLPVVRAFVRWSRRIGSSRVNLAVSNVPGPTAPLWLGGARMLKAVPVAPLVPLVPLSVAALSYAGSLVVAVNADASITDLGVVAAGMTKAFACYDELAARSAG